MVSRMSALFESKLKYTLGNGLTDGHPPGGVNGHEVNYWLSEFLGHWLKWQQYSPTSSSSNFHTMS